MAGYIRTDISYMWHSQCYLIPTISIERWAKGFEISFQFLWFVGYAVLSYIKEDEYEP